MIEAGDEITNRLPKDRTLASQVIRKGRPEKARDAEFVDTEAVVGRDDARGEASILILASRVTEVSRSRPRTEPGVMPKRVTGRL